MHTVRTDFYPSKADIELGPEFLPPSLKLLTKILVGQGLKQASLGQCILKAMRPNSVIPPLLFGLSVAIDHAIGSKSLLTETSKLGYAISYDEVKRYKQSVLTDEEHKLGHLKDGFTQFVADNADHNTETVDSKGIFHGMGIIACSILNNDPPDKRAKRIQTVVKKEAIERKDSIKLQWYQGKDVRSLSKVILTPLKDIKEKTVVFKTVLNVDLLWHTSGIFHKAERQRSRPNWNGFMEQLTYEKINSPKSTITMLPLIDLNPSDESCIYSTLIHIINQAKYLNIETPCVTFDQPLWIKAFKIVKTKNLRIVLRLGGFHSLMSFVGIVGFSTEGSGLEKVFETVCGKNTVTHMFSGKIISRALRCHFLVDAPLRMKLIKYLLPETTVSINEKVTEEATDQNVSNATLLPFRGPLLQE